MSLLARLTFCHVAMVQRLLHALQEWFHFVDKEKQVRVRIDGKVNQMMAEAAELKQWTISEVCRSSGTILASSFSFALCIHLPVCLPYGCHSLLQCGNTYVCICCKLSWCLSYSMGCQIWGMHTWVQLSSHTAHAA